MTQAAFVDIEFDGRATSLEYAWVEPANAPLASDALRRAAVDVPLVVFLHEGLGSLSMWKDYPQRLCDACGCRGLVFSRAGYGRSTPRRAAERWPVDFMNRQARGVLPRLFDRLGVGADGNPPWLLGHSDGGSIALIYAAAFPDAVAGVVAVAPHIFVEDASIASIVAARDAYHAKDLRTRLARYHADPDSAFFGWNDAWLDPAFRDWSIEPMLDLLRCPILAVQGEDDEYGTLAQVTGIGVRVPHGEVVILADCGHSPQRDQPEALMRAVADFIARHSKARANKEPLS